MASVSSDDLIKFVNERYIKLFYNGRPKNMKKMVIKAADSNTMQSLSNDDKNDIIVELIEYNEQYFHKRSIFSNFISFKIMLQFLDNLMKDNDCPDMEDKFVDAIYSLSSYALEQDTFRNTNNDRRGSLIEIFNETYHKNKALCNGYVREGISQNADVTKYLSTIIYDFEFETNSVIQRIMQVLLREIDNGDVKYIIDRILYTLGQIIQESTLFPSLPMRDIMKDIIDYHSILKHFQTWLHDPQSHLAHTVSTENECKAAIFRMLTQFVKFDYDGSITAKVIQNGLFHTIIRSIGYMDDTFHGYAEDDALEFLLMFIQNASEKHLLYAVNVEIEDVFSKILKYVNLCACDIKEENAGQFYFVGVYINSSLLHRCLDAVVKVLHFGDEQTLSNFEQQKGLSMIREVKRILLERRDIDRTPKTNKLYTYMYMYNTRKSGICPAIKSCESIIDIFS